MYRKGHISKIYDFGPLTIACCGEYFSNGSHKWPRIDLIFRDRWLAGPSCTGGRALAYRRVSLPLPYVRFAYPQNFIMRKLHKGFDRLYRKMFYCASYGPYYTRRQRRMHTEGKVV